MATRKKAQNRAQVQPTTGPNIAVLLKVAEVLGISAAELIAKTAAAMGLEPPNE